MSMKNFVFLRCKVKLVTVMFFPKLCVKVKDPNVYLKGAKENGKRGYY